MFEDFLKEKQYLVNVSPRTLEWYKQALGWLYVDDQTKRVWGLDNHNGSSVFPSIQKQAEAISQNTLTACIIRMREKGLSARSINSYRTAINSYLHWLGVDVRMPRMKCEEKVLPVFSPGDIQTIVKWKPKTRCDKRLQAIMLTLADTGARIDEVLSLKWSEVDFDNLLLTVTGKGNKQRKIPFSFELRKVLYAYSQGRTLCPRGNNGRSNRQDASQRNGCDGLPNKLLAFSTRGDNKLGRRNVLRDVKRVCKRLGVQVPERTLHAFRHTWALNAVRRGASVFHVQRQRGHTTLDMSKRYVNLTVDDLRPMTKVTLLSYPAG